uniref:J domain-containing protein n=1 Tax=viral metagenome TaxID=1070528 RepID=A0A6C0B3W3_9ZZZZ
MAKAGRERMAKYYPLIILALVALLGYSVYMYQTAKPFNFGDGGGGPTSRKEQAEELLGLSGDYTTSQVKTAFREKSRGVHPDRNKSPEAQAEFIKLTEAKEFLLSQL